jgi:hypothetical protein
MNFGHSPQLGYPPAIARHDRQVGAMDNGHEVPLVKLSDAILYYYLLLQYSNTPSIHVNETDQLTP